MELLTTALSCILYSMDPQAQYCSLTAASRKRAAASKIDAKAVDKALGKPEKPKFNFDLVLAESANDHMQRTMAAGSFFSVPAPLASLCGLHPAPNDNSAALGANSVSRQALAKSTMVLEMDGGMDAQAALPTRLLKTVPLGTADARRHHVSKGSLCVTFHESSALGEATARVNSLPLRAPGLLSITGHDLPVLKDSLLSWQFSAEPPSLSFSCVDFPADVIQRS